MQFVGGPIARRIDEPPTLSGKLLLA